MAPSNAVAPSAKSDSPYQLDPDQTLRASTALLKHLKTEARRLEGASSKKNLLASTDHDSSDSEADAPAEDTPVWLLLTTKQHMVDKARLKPGKIPVPHSLNTSSSLSICLITADPQRAVKDVVADPAFPQELAGKITKIIGYTKLKARYSTFESRRQLLNEHDVFLADDRIILRLIETLGKVFYKSHGKKPIPVNIAPKNKDENGKTVKPEKRRFGVPKAKGEQYAGVAPPAIVAAEIQRTLSSIPISIKPGASCAVKVGKVAFTPDHLSDNINVAVRVIIEKYVVKGWRNIKAIHIKGPNSAALPIWLADELWVDGKQDIVDDSGNGPQELEATKRFDGVSPSGDGERGQKRKSKHRLEGDKVRGKKAKPEDEKQQKVKAAEKERDNARKEKLNAMKKDILAE